MNLRFSIDKIGLTVLFLFNVITCLPQKVQNVFKWFGYEFETDSFRLTKPLRFYEVVCSKTGLHKFSSSFGLIRDNGVEMEILLYTGADNKTKKLTRNYLGEDGIRSICESPSKLVFFVSHDNRIFWQPSDDGGIGFTPFSFPPIDKPNLKVSKIWIDAENSIYLGTYEGDLYFIKRGGIMSPYDGELDSAGNFKVKRGEKPVRRIVLGSGAEINSFAQDLIDPNKIWIGTDSGLFSLNKTTMQAKNVLKNDENKNQLTITHVEADSSGAVWFSTLENGMGYYTDRTSSIKFFNSKRNYSIKNFCKKSTNEFFVAVADSLPAVFNTTSGSYLFIQDSIFSKTADSTSDIKLDGFGNLLIIKGGGLFYTDFYKESKRFAFTPVENRAYAPFITEIMVMGIPYRSEGNLKNLKNMHLKYNENSLTINYSIAELIHKKDVQFAWLVEGYINEWVILPISGNAVMPAFLSGLAPGKYIFRLKARVGNEDWRAQQAKLEIIISPPFWQAWWFWASIIAGLSALIYSAVKLRVRTVRKQERIRATHEKELLELEAKALRAQMNPHFIFNCLNSIKSLIQQHEEEKSVTYLTTFSKLIRTLFNNADKKEISLHDEIETCRLYLQLEAMRFDSSFSYTVNVDENLDLKSVRVPALIIQPFIENAIWHGLVPKGANGYVDLSVQKKNGSVEIIIDDNGIGREASTQNKPASGLTHQSKGVNLTQSRLELDNLLQQRHAQLEVIDKKDESGISIGTKVIVKINEEMI